MLAARAEETTGVAESADVQRTLIRGVSFMTIRQLAAHGIGALTGLVLARTLSPSEFGVYAIANFFFYFLLGLGDLGFGASLVRSSEQPSDTEYRQVLAVRQILDLCITCAVWLGASRLSSAYGLGEEGIWLFRALALAAFGTSFHLLPCLKLERTMDFRSLALIEIGQVLAYSATVLALVHAGVGVLSFGAGWIAFSAVGAVLANYALPSRVAWEFDLPRLRSQLPFALPYQGLGLLQLAKDSMNPILVGIFLGTQAAGYVNWAFMLGTFSTLAVAGLQRTYLPLFSRLQNDRTQLVRVFEHVLSLTNALNLAIAVVVLALAQPIAEHVFGSEWVPALPIFYCLWTANIVTPTFTATLSILNALGDSRTGFRFVLVSVVAGWALAVPLIQLFGVNGFVAAFFAIQVATCAFISQARRRLGFSYRALVGPAVMAVLTYAFLSVIIKLFPPSGIALVAGTAVFGCLIYLAGFRLFFWNSSGAPSR